MLKPLQLKLYTHHNIPFPRKLIDVVSGIHPSTTAYWSPGHGGTSLNRFPSNWRKLFWGNTWVFQTCSTGRSPQLRNYICSLEVSSNQMPENLNCLPSMWSSRDSTLKMSQMNKLLTLSSWIQMKRQKVKWEYLAEISFLWKFYWTKAFNIKVKIKTDNDIPISST